MMRPTRPAWMLVPLLGGTLMLASCGPGVRSVGISQASPSVPDSLSVTRHDHTPGITTQTFHTTIRVPTEVASLYRGLLLLPKLRQNSVYSCPAGSNVSYDLAFLRGGTTVRRATLDMNGCDTVRLSGDKGLRMTSGTRGSLWLGTLLRALGLRPCWFFAMEQSAATCPVPPN